MRCAAPAYAHARPAMRFFDRRARGASSRTARGRVSPAARNLAAPAISAIYFYFARTCAFAFLHIWRLESHASFRISCVSKDAKPRRGRERNGGTGRVLTRSLLSCVRARAERAFLDDDTSVLGCDRRTPPVALRSLRSRTVVSVMLKRRFARPTRLVRYVTRQRLAAPCPAPWLASSRKATPSSRRWPRRAQAWRRRARPPRRAAACTTWCRSPCGSRSS